MLGELDRIAEKVEEDLAQARRVPLQHARQGWIELDVQADVLVGSLKGDDPHHIVHEAARTESSLLQDQLEITEGVVMQDSDVGQRVLEAQLRHLHQYGELEIHGYYFSRPLPATQLKEWMAKGVHAPM